MDERQINLGEGSLCFHITGNKAEITGYKGQDARLVIPARIEGCPVTGIGRKAFLSQKELYGVVLPESIEEVGDWAFANCSGLAEISFPGREVRFGRAVFKNCGKLRRIQVRAYPEVKERRKQDYSEQECREQEVAGCAAWELLAAAVTMLDAYYLLDLPRAGSREWLARWDTKLLAVLRTSDQEGYISQSVYGEEDYIGTDLEEYASERRKEKVRLALLRLLHSQELSASLRGELEDFLRSQTRGRGGGETWQVVLEEYGGEREYYSLFAELGCIEEENFDGILGDMGGDYPEMKAFFLKFREEERSQEDFFEGLEL